MSRIDWPGLMRVGIGETGLAPDDFWRLTPFELTAITGRETRRGDAPLDRSGLEALIRRHPDRAPRREGGAT